MSNNFVFKEESGHLVYVGDFEGLYQSESDPWGQSASSGSAMDAFYKQSRGAVAHIIGTAFPHTNISILEVGCGLGHSTAYLSGCIENSTLTGMDISSTAILAAQKLHPSLHFVQGDIRQQSVFEAHYDVVLLHQMLWYVLDDLPQVLHHARQALKPQPSSICLISQAFPREQRYGKDVLNGYEGAIQYFKNQSGIHLLHSTYSDQPSLPHIDCHFVLHFQ